MNYRVPKPRLMTFIAAALFLAACQVQGTAGAAAIEGENAVAVQELGEIEIIERWLECDDCLDGELEAVVQLGDDVLPILLEYLDVGPREETLKLLDASLQQSYAELSEYAEKKKDRTLIPRQSQEEYVTFFKDNIFSQYQTRSAIAIQQIDNKDAIEKARELLEEALAITERDDLRAKLILSLEQLK